MALHTAFPNGTMVSVDSPLPPGGGRGVELGTRYLMRHHSRIRGLIVVETRDRETGFTTKAPAAHITDDMGTLVPLVSGNYGTALRDGAGMAEAILFA